MIMLFIDQVFFFFFFPFSFPLKKIFNKKMMPYFRDCITKMVETSRGRTLLKSSSDAEVTTSEVIFFF